MKLTTSVIRRLIKEELQGMLSEQNEFPGYDNLDDHPIINFRGVETREVTLPLEYEGELMEGQFTSVFEFIHGYDYFEGYREDGSLDVIAERLDDDIELLFNGSNTSNGFIELLIGFTEGAFGGYPQGNLYVGDQGKTNLLVQWDHNKLKILENKPENEILDVNFGLYSSKVGSLGRLVNREISKDGQVKPDAKYFIKFLGGEGSRNRRLSISTAKVNLKNIFEDINNGILKLEVEGYDGAFKYILRPA